MGKNQRFALARKFAKHLIRGGVKSIPYVGNLFDEITFGMLDEIESEKASEEIHKKLDELQKEYKDNVEADLVQILAGMSLQDDFNEEVRKEFTKIKQLLRDPENAPVPGSFNSAFEKLIEQNEELKQEIGKVQKGVSGLVDDHDWQDEKLNRIDAKVTAIFDKMLDEAGSGNGLSRKRTLEIWFSEQWPETDANVFGRDEQLEVLNEAWEQDKIRVVSLVAAGGVGKTAIVNRWKNFQMVPNSWCGAERVFGWSFYSQGSEEGRQVSGDKFIQKALEWFGDEDPAKGSPWDKGVRLAELVKTKRTLLLLDGLEPLQEPPGSKTGNVGKIKDPSVAALLRSLAMGDSGLCVISTRVRIWDLKSYEKGPALQKDLDNLTKEMGVAYLRSLDVHGLEDELKDASEEYGNHALALTLLGNFLRIHKGGDICCRSEITDLLETREHGKHAERVMAFYEKWFEGQAEIDLLYVLGLFDRPVERGALDTVCGDTTIEGLTEVLGGLTTSQWEDMLDVLRNARLISRDSSRDKLDCHPLIREHFGEKLKEGNPVAWREAHSRLYEYYKDTAKELPDTLEEMEPLFAAVAHGCAAGRHQETLDDVYWERIKRGKEQYSTKKLGAFGADLAALAGFFEKCWSKPAARLIEKAKAFILTSAGYSLRGVGRLREAAEPMEVGLEAHINQENWKEAAPTAGNLSELYLTLGEVKRSVEYARQGVGYADKSGDKFQIYSKRTTLADALHQAGEKSKAEELFGEAEEIQKEYSPEDEYLYSVQGYRFCDLLLSQGKYKEVQKRAEQTLKEGESFYSLLSKALDKLSLGRAYMVEVSAEGTGDFGKVREYLDAAVEGLREAGQQQELPRGLLGRAEVFRRTGEYEKAWQDLEEAREIAERGEMKLHIADCALEACRLNLAQKANGKAKEELKRAKELIEGCGYHRRDREVEELEREVKENRK